MTIDVKQVNAGDWLAALAMVYAWKHRNQAYWPLLRDFGREVFAFEVATRPAVTMNCDTGTQSATWIEYTFSVDAGACK